MAETSPSDDGKEEKGKDFSESREAIRHSLVTSSGVYRHPILSRATANLRDELHGMSPWCSQSSIPCYWRDRGGKQAGVGAVAGRGSVKTHGDVSYGKHHNRHGHQNNPPGCPLHGQQRKAKGDADESDETTSTISRHSKTYAKVTSPAPHSDTPMGISLIPDASRSPPAAPSQPVGSTVSLSPRRHSVATHASQGRDTYSSLSVYYTPYHHFKQLLSNEAARAPPATGMELRQQCQQLSNYLWTREQQMQIQQQADSLTGAHGNYPRPEHVDALQMLHVSSAPQIVNPHVPEQIWAQRTEQVLHTDSAEQMRRTSLTAINVEPNLPTFSSAFDHLIIDPGSKYNLISRASHQRRPSNPPVSNLPQQANWTVTQKAVQAELLSLDCAKIKEQTQASTARMTAQASQRDKEKMVLESKEVREERQSWRPAESQLDISSQKQSNRPGKTISQTCSMVEMSLPNAQAFQKGKLPAKQTNSMVNFPMIPSKSRRRQVSIQKARSHGAQIRQDQYPTVLPQIDGFKFMGDVGSQAPHTRVTNGHTATQSGWHVSGRGPQTGSSTSVKKKKLPGRQLSRPKPAARTLAPSHAGNQSSPPPPAARPSKSKTQPGHLAVEWRAV